MTTTIENTATVITTKSFDVFNGEWSNDTYECKATVSKNTDHYILAVCNSSDTALLYVDKEVRENDLQLLLGELQGAIKGHFYHTSHPQQATLFKAIYVWASQVIGQHISDALMAGTIECENEYITFTNTGLIAGDVIPSDGNDFGTIEVWLARNNEYLMKLDAKALLKELTNNPETAIYYRTDGDYLLKQNLLSRVRDSKKAKMAHTDKLTTYTRHIENALDDLFFVQRADNVIL